MWTVKLQDGGVATICKPFRYPDNLFPTPTPLEMDEEPPLAADIKTDLKYNYFNRPVTAPERKFPIPGETKEVVKPWVSNLKKGVLPVVVAAQAVGVADDDTAPLGAAIQLTDFGPTVGHVRSFVVA